MEYDADGIRCKKQVPSSNTTITYTYQGNNLIQEKIVLENGSQSSTTTQTFLYNSQGVIGFVQGGTTYTYRKNMFGDIVAIYQGATKIAEYAYDAWGNCTIVSDTNNVGRDNPFRYHGYYWDNDLNLYYLMSRYYDPQVGRFINADTLDYLDPETIGGLNLYAYGSNNPINYCDPTGHFPWVSMLIGAAIGFLTSYISDVINEMKDGFDWSDFDTFEENGLKYVGAAIGGAIGGLGAGLISTILASGAGNVVEAAFAGQISNFGDVLTQFAIGGISGGAGYGISKGITKIFADKKIFGIIGKISDDNLKINNRLKEAGFGKLKIGRDGLDVVYDEMYESLGFGRMKDCISYAYDFIIGLSI